MAIPEINVLGNPNVTEGNFQIAIEDLRKSVIGSGKAYDSANTYSQYDTCVSGGVVYYSKINSNTGNTPTVGTNWGLIGDLITGVVHKTGDETISGVKTFSDNTKLNSDVLINVSTQKGKVHIGSSAYQWTIHNLGIDLVIDGSKNNAIAFLDASSSNPAAIYNNAGGLVFATNMPALTDKTSPSTERLRIDTAGNVLVTGSGGLGYGTGSGGTVTQLTNKGESVTLNKPTGTIIMNNSALIQNAKISFLLYNSLIAGTDNIILSVTNGSTVLAQYEVRGRCSNGAAEIVVSHTYSSSLSESVVLKFDIIKGATA